MASTVISHGRGLAALVLMGGVMFPALPAKAVALLDGLGGPRGYGALAINRSDDGSSAELNLPFSVNFFGNTFSTFYINNNGNVSFNGPVGTFSPDPFPIAGQPMIAPYWSDVDTRNDPGDDTNSVWVATPDPQTVVTTWDQVGYYDQHNDLRNSYQLVLRDRSGDTGTPGDFDIEFRYELLEWTTGDLNGGTGGFGGISAQAGFDAGDLTNFLVLPGSQTGDVLNLQHSGNVGGGTPGLWTFPVRNGQLGDTGPVPEPITAALGLMGLGGLGLATRRRTA